MLKYFLIPSFLLYIVTFSSACWSENNTTEPLQLQKIMKTMGQDMQDITAGISNEDWDSIKQAALKIADHPKPPFTEKIRILSFIGTEVSEFKKFDDITHNSAKTLADLAEQQDGNAIIEKFAELQKSCLSCHQKFRQSFKTHFYGQ